MNLPALPLAQWEDTKVTLHLMLQIVGKLQLAFAPKQNHWWHTTLYITPKGISSQPIPFGNNESLEIVFNLKKHRVEICASTGFYQEIALKNGLSVAYFYQKIEIILKELGLATKTITKPFDVPHVTDSFKTLTALATYQPEYAEHYHQVLLFTDKVFKKFKGESYSKTCPVQLYWHHMDLTLTRFSGKEAPKMPAEASQVEKEAYSHELISFGFWAGDDNVREPAYYSYTFPLPQGIAQQPLKPHAASWVASNGSPMAFLPYEAVRTASNPEQALLDFLESSYQAGASLANWPLKELKNEWIEYNG